MKKIFYAVALISEILLVAAVFILENLAAKKAGVNHHVLARKSQWETTVFRPENIKILSAMLIILIIALVFMELHELKKRKRKNHKSEFEIIQIIIAVLAAVVAILSQRNSYFLEMKTTPYITFAALTIFVFQAIILILNSFGKNNK